MSHAVPPPPLDDELLLLLEELELLVEPEELLLELVLVSGLEASTRLAESRPPSAVPDAGGSFAPGSGVTLFSATSAPRSSEGEVAHAEAAKMRLRLPSETTTTQAMAGRRMGNTLAAQVCRQLEPPSTETLR